MTDSRKIVLFDLDGTIVPWDMQLLFFNFIIRRKPWRWFLLSPFFFCLPFYLIGLLNETTMKRLFLAYLTRFSRIKIKEYTQQFVREYVMPLSYSEVLDRLKVHQSSGDLCILVSASPTLYVEEVGKAWGFDLSLGTDTEETDPFPFFPKLPLGNNKGETKVVRLRKMGYLPRESASIPAGSIAYSDSSADLPMLLAVESAVLVNPSVKLLKAAKGKDWEVITPSRPWTGKVGFILSIIKQLYGLYPPPKKP